MGANVRNHHVPTHYPMSVQIPQPKIENEPVSAEDRESDLSTKLGLLYQLGVALAKLAASTKLPDTVSLGHFMGTVSLFQGFDPRSCSPISCPFRLWYYACISMAHVLKQIPNAGTDSLTTA